MSSKGVLQKLKRKVCTIQQSSRGQDPPTICSYKVWQAKCCGIKNVEATRCKVRVHRKFDAFRPRGGQGKQNLMCQKTLGELKISERVLPVLAK